MANMSYCRFWNTHLDLRDCYNHLGDNLEHPDEIWARKQIVELCRDIVAEWENAYGDIEDSEEEMESDDA